MEQHQERHHQAATGTAGHLAFPSTAVRTWKMRSTYGHTAAQRKGCRQTAAIRPRSAAFWTMQHLAKYVQQFPKLPALEAARLCQQRQFAFLWQGTCSLTAPLAARMVNFLARQHFAASPPRFEGASPAYCICGQWSTLQMPRQAHMHTRLDRAKTPTQTRSSACACKDRDN